MKKRLFAPLVAAIFGLLVVTATGSAIAAHPEASLPGSEFEIDDDANLIVDDGAPSTDWAALAHPDGPEVRALDLQTGHDDDSYKGGSKENTECPGEVTGSIPNNKSDLLTFHVFEEPGSGGHPGFLNMAWSRVSEPSGTTLMDFEFNQSDVDCPQGPNKVRTAGDLLIEYAIDQGGARADISGRFWDGSAWGSPIDLDSGTMCGGGPCAAGTINQTVIADGDSDGIGEKQPRTFGEAQIDLRLIFDDQSCVSFGSAMLKSRSSDSFTSQLKDFIRPVDIDLQNCGTVIVRKQTIPDGAADEFGYTKDFPTDPAGSNTFSLVDDESIEFDNVLFGSGYTVDETSLPTGWVFDSVDCSASTGVTPVIAGSLVTFAIDNADDVLDCTYTNEALARLTVVKVSERAGAFDFTSSTLTPAAFTLTTTGPGEGGSDSLTFEDLSVGTYDAAETVPAGWNLESATCSNGDDPSAVTLGGGDDVTCTFTNVLERGAIEIVKTRKHAADGPGDHPHAGVTFEVFDSNGASVGSVVTDAQGVACVDGLVISQFDGDYSVVETVPAGYVPDGATSKNATVVESTCASGAAQVNFANTPLTDFTVSVDSQVDGGTASTISCVDENGAVVAEDLTNAPGDVTTGATNLLPGTYTCTIVIDP